MDRPRFVLVGSGIAALSAAEAIRQHAPGSALHLVSEEKHDFYSRPGLAYFLRGDIPEKQLFVRSREEIKSLHLHRIIGRVTEVMPDRRELVLSNGQRLPYDRLLLATGALAVPPPFPGNELDGVVKLDGLDDTQTILQKARRAKAAVVVGGGITALELVEGLKARGLHVHYFLRGQRYWGDVLDEGESQIVLRRLAHEGIEIHPETQVKQVIGSAGKVAAVETQAGRILRCQMVAVAIGVKPRIELARQAGLKTNKGILVDEFLRTSQPAIYAAGDVAEVVNPRTGTATLDVLWPIALAQGRIAGANMAGAQQPYQKGISYNVTMLAGLKVAIIGAVGAGKNEDLISIMRGESESWRYHSNTLVHFEGNDVNRIRLMIGKRKLHGALVMGDQTWAGPLKQLIAAEVDISPIRSTLAAGTAGSLDQLQNLYEQWKQGAGK